MNKNLKNILIVVGIITFTLGGYLLFANQDRLSPLTSSNTSQLDDLIVVAQNFRERQQILDRIELNTSLFTDQRFTSLQDYSTSPDTFLTGRVDPFREIGSVRAVGQVDDSTLSQFTPISTGTTSPNISPNSPITSITGTTSTTTEPADDAS